MFIKWRTYQRQLNGIKGDKYIQQPIIVKSYRLGIKNMKKMFPNMPEDALDHPEVRKKVLRPRHEVILKLPSYPVCMTIYFRSPEFMKQRYKWWKEVDAILKKLTEIREDFTGEVVEKLKADIEKNVPRVTPEEVEKLKADIEKNVPRVTPEEVEKLKVVLNDLPLHL